MRKNKRTASEAAFHLLGYRAQSEWEIRTKLKQKGYTDEEIQKTVEILYKGKYLDDEALANELFSLYRDNLNYGDRYIQGKLRSRGLTIELHLTDEEEREKAIQALLGKMKTCPGYCENYNRAIGFLSRRGFSYDAARYALDSLITE